MPTGHTDKRTMTPGRLLLLRDLALRPVLAIDTTPAERRQLTEMIRFGWVAEAGRTYHLTDDGRSAIDAQTE